MVGCRVTVVLSHLQQQKSNYCLKDNCLGLFFSCLIPHSCGKAALFCSKDYSYYRFHWCNFPFPIAVLWLKASSLLVDSKSFIHLASFYILDVLKKNTLLSFFNCLNFSEDDNLKRKVNPELEDKRLWKGNNCRIYKHSSLLITQSVNGWLLSYFFDEEINVNNL